jgi:hypothetical protein
MAAGNLATRLRRFATAAIVKPVEVAGHLRLLTDPRLLPARCPLFRRVAVVADVVVAVDDVNLFPTGGVSDLSFVRSFPGGAISPAEYLTMPIGLLIVFATHDIAETYWTAYRLMS